MDKIAIIGGGFAGVQAARAVLRELPGASITLFDQHPYATMLPALPDLLSGRFDPRALSHSLADLLPAECELVTERVTALELDEQRLTAGGADYEYDSVIVTAGSTPAPPPWDTSIVPAFGVQSLPRAIELREEVMRRLCERETFSIVVAGAGYTGLETAIALRDGCGEPERCEITVVDPAEGLLPMVNDRERARLLAFLADRKVNVCAGTVISSVSARAVELSDGTAIGDPLLIWAGGMRAQPVLRAEQVSASGDGRLTVNEHLQVDGHPDVFAAGDAAALEGDETLLRRAVNFAYFSGRIAGRNAARQLKRKPLKKFTPVDLGWIIPLGDESAGRLFGTIPVGGRLGTRLHYLMCGLRHFAPAPAWTFYTSAVRMRRRMNPLTSVASQGAQGG